VRRSLDERVLALIGEGPEASHDDARFAALALDLFAYQYQNNAPYRRLCDALGRPPERVSDWREIPPVPSGAFKEARLACFAPEREVRVFRTSGSTTRERGALHLDSLALYEASLLASFDAYLCQGERLRFAILAPPASEAPDSSLSYMFDCALRKLGAEGSRFWVHAEGWEPDSLLDELRAQHQPVLLAGTAFAFVHLTDELDARGEALRLPLGSRVMETGGFKGRSRELSREELHGAIERSLAVPRERIVNQYGMCELGSQFYEDSLLRGRASQIKRVPPWVRTRVLDPGSLAELPPGEPGVLVHYDLANTGSVLAVQTSDLGRGCDSGFEVLGRIQGAELRGCSLAADLLLGGAA
jgi:hypothetical protein